MNREHPIRLISALRFTLDDLVDVLEMTKMLFNISLECFKVLLTGHPNCVAYSIFGLNIPRTSIAHESTIDHYDQIITERLGFIHSMGG